MTEQQGSACGEESGQSNTLSQELKSGQSGSAEVRVVKTKKMLRERMRMVMDVTLFEPILKGELSILD
jgi:hypothetical protein